MKTEAIRVLERLGIPHRMQNGGMRGLQIELSPHALVRAANAAVADLTETA